jgi:hypothetical protein
MKSVELNKRLPGSNASTARVFSRINYGWIEETPKLYVGELQIILAVNTFIL